MTGGTGDMLQLIDAETSRALRGAAKTLTDRRWRSVTLLEALASQTNDNAPVAAVAREIGIHSSTDPHLHAGIVGRWWMKQRARADVVDVLLAAADRVDSVWERRRKQRKGQRRRRRERERTARHERWRDAVAS